MTASSISDTYLLFINVTSGADSTGVAPTSSTVALALTIPQDGSPQLSPIAQILSQLQQLQQQDPTEYAQLTQQISADLQSAAQTVQTAGNATAAIQLGQLATEFSSASQSGQLPDLQSASSDTDTSQSQSQSVSSLYGISNQNDSLSALAVILDTLSSAGTSNTNT